MAAQQGSIPTKSAEQRAKLRARPAVRRHGMSHKPSTSAKGAKQHGS